jgi:protein TonB
MLCVAVPATATAQGFPPPSDGSSLQGWKVEHTNAEIADGVLRVGKGNGWVRTERVYADFVLTLDIRMPVGREAGIFVRAWPTFNGSTPTNGYRLKLSAAKTAPQSGQWERLELECAGHTVRVRVDGQIVHTADTLGNPQGHIALSAPDGTVEFRAIAIKPVPLPQPIFRPDVAEARPGSGIQSPKVLTNPKPRYTADAMRARITGTVRMQAIVLPDGTMGDVEILQSLDPKFGLDEEAVNTAKKWTFSPALRDSQPVAVRIMIDLDFNLR